MRSSEFEPKHVPVLLIQTSYAGIPLDTNIATVAAIAAPLLLPALAEVSIEGCIYRLNQIPDNSWADIYCQFIISIKHLRLKTFTTSLAVLSGIGVTNDNLRHAFGFIARPSQTPPNAVIDGMLNTYSLTRLDHHSP